MTTRTTDPTPSQNRLKSNAKLATTPKTKRAHSSGCPELRLVRNSYMAIPGRGLGAT